MYCLLHVRFVNAIISTQIVLTRTRVSRREVLFILLSSCWLKKLQNIITNFGIYDLLLSFQIFTRICQMNILAFHVDCD